MSQVLSIKTLKTVNPLKVSPEIIPLKVSPEIIPFKVNPETIPDPINKDPSITRADPSTSNPISNHEIPKEALQIIGISVTTEIIILPGQTNSKEIEMTTNNQITTSKMKIETIKSKNQSRQ